MKRGRRVDQIYRIRERSGRGHRHHRRGGDIRCDHRWDGRESDRRQGTARAGLWATVVVEVRSPFIGCDLARTVFIG